MEYVKLEIVTPNGVIFDRQVRQVTLPGADGEFGVLPKHAALVSLLTSGLIAIETDSGKEIAVAIDSGYCKVDETKILCVVDGAVALCDEEGDLEKALSEAKELLQKAQASATVIAAAVSKVERMSKH